MTLPATQRRRIRTTAVTATASTISASLSGTAPPKDCAVKASRVVCGALAGCGLGADEIEAELRKYPNGIAAKFIKRLRREVGRCYAKWQQANQNSALTASDATSPHNWDDPDMSILDDRRGDLPNFPTDVFCTTNPRMAGTCRTWRGRVSRSCRSADAGGGRKPDRHRTACACISLMVGADDPMDGARRRLR